MKRNVNQNRMIRVLAASLWLAGIAVYPLQGEAALPTHPECSDRKQTRNS